MEKTFIFENESHGVIAHIRVNLEDEGNNKLVFRVYGKMEHARALHSPLNLIANHINDPVFCEIHRLAKLYQNNDMHSGTPEQEAAVRDLENQGKNYNYNVACAYLTRIGLYEANYNGKPYKYGTDRLYYPIPEPDLTKIKNLINS